MKNASTPTTNNPADEVQLWNAEEGLLYDSQTEEINKDTRTSLPPKT